MDGALIASMLVGLLGVLLLLRNRLVSAVRMKRLEAIARRANQLIAQRLDRSWMQLYSDFQAGPSYMSMVFDLRKWTYRDFYPEDL